MFGCSSLNRVWDFAKTSFVFWSLTVSEISRVQNLFKKAAWDNLFISNTCSWNPSTTSGLSSQKVWICKCQLFLRSQSDKHYVAGHETYDQKYSMIKWKKISSRYYFSLFSLKNSEKSVKPSLKNSAVKKDENLEGKKKTNTITIRSSAGNRRP